MKKQLPLIAVLLLAACGSGSDSPVPMAGGINTTMATTTPAAAAAPASNPFFDEVAAIIGRSAEDTEPSAIGSITPSLPEDMEPMPLG